MNEKFKIIIPARYKSSRFPGKPLKKILGKEMVIRVADICSKITKKENIIIATDNNLIKQTCEDFGYRSLMTPKSCKTGTDRCYQAAKKIKSNFYINVQGDEPLIRSSDILKVIKAKKKFRNHIICGYTNATYSEAKNINVPKVLINNFSDLIFMSRSLIPGCKNINNKKKINYFKQVCIYAFNYNELKEFYNYGKKSLIEKYEDIEILRFFEIKKPIKMVKLSKSSIAVDVKTDIAKVSKILKIKK
tara:strand:+ start:719 stop:1459 length:741 start_codon:yes stop_codon:yes gene_type:complete